MLYTQVLKYEELKSSKQELYHYDKDNYNKSAWKGGKILWVLLIKKVYAKLHGNYSYLIGRWDCEAIEDLTG